jgi:hypothetical protein
MGGVDVIRKREGGAFPSIDVIERTITAQAVP